MKRISIFMEMIHMLIHLKMDKSIHWISSVYATRYRKVPYKVLSRQLFQLFSFFPFFLLYVLTQKKNRKYPIDLNATICKFQFSQEMPNGRRFFPLCFDYMK